MADFTLIIPATISLAALSYSLVKKESLGKIDYRIRKVKDYEISRNSSPMIIDHNPKYKEVKNLYLITYRLDFKNNGRKHLRRTDFNPPISLTFQESVYFEMMPSHKNLEFYSNGELLHSVFIRPFHLNTGQNISADFRTVSIIPKPKPPVFHANIAGFKLRKRWN